MTSRSASIWLFIPHPPSQMSNSESLSSPFWWRSLPSHTTLLKKLAFPHYITEQRWCKYIYFYEYPYLRVYHSFLSPPEMNVKPSHFSLSLFNTHVWVGNSKFFVCWVVLLCVHYTTCCIIKTGRLSGSVSSLDLDIDLDYFRTGRLSGSVSSLFGGTGTGTGRTPPSRMMPLLHGTVYIYNIYTPCVVKNITSLCLTLIWTLWKNKFQRTPTPTLSHATTPNLMWSFKPYVP